MLSIVLLTTHVPKVRFHGLFATGGVLLSLERCLVLRDLLEIRLAEFHCLANCGEACTSVQRARRLTDLVAVGVRLTDVQTRTIGALGRSRAVRTDQVLAVAVAIYFLRFCQGALYELNTRRIGYFSNS